MKSKIVSVILIGFFIMYIFALTALLWGGISFWGDELIIKSQEGILTALGYAALLMSIAGGLAYFIEIAINGLLKSIKEFREKQNG